jgi:CheY-like chemotaxis protein
MSDNGKNCRSGAAGWSQTPHHPFLADRAAGATFRDALSFRWLAGEAVRSASLLARLLAESGQAGPAHHLVRDAAPNLEGVDILLAENNEISRRVALKHLGRHGARLATAEGFGAIILDIRMPVLDGLAAARHIRAAEPAGHRTPLIALTANAFASDKRAAIEAGIDYFIAKPVDPFDLVALIETALARTYMPQRQLLGA